MSKNKNKEECDNYNKIPPSLWVQVEETTLQRLLREFDFFCGDREKMREFKDYIPVLKKR